MILDEIVEYKKEEMTGQKNELPLDSFIDELVISRYNFKEALQEGRGINLISEVKRKSPSRGMINEDLDFDSIINMYDKHPLVSAISFLTDEKYFGGSLDKLQSIRDKTEKPILRKDFIIDPYQIYQARYFGADAILLIAKLLSKNQLSDYIDIANKYKMDVLLEIHQEKEIEKIPDNAEIVGINNRNLENMDIDLETTVKLAPEIRNKVDVIVAESGILNHSDLSLVKNSADAVLIGSSIMADKDPEKKIDSIFCPQIKICGLTREADVMFAAENGADFLGFIFYEGSDRYIKPDKAEKIIKKVKNSFPDINITGVFVNENIHRLKDIVKKCNLDYIQLHGDESPEYVEKVEQTVVKAIQVKDGIDLKEEVNKYDTDYILLDTFDTDKYGGTGETFDWNVLEQVENKEIFLAGGIGPDNIEQAISYQTFAIDINSGVEQSPGQKSKQKMQQILRIRDE